MHRHGYKGKKFNRERDQRRALLKGLADSLIKHESIETTLPKAKEVSSYTEKLITKAKKGDLHNRRQIISSLNEVSNAHKLIDEIAPKYKDRSSGHLTISRSRTRRGDNAQLARISFVEISEVKPKKEPATKAKAAKAPPKAATKAKKAES